MGTASLLKGVVLALLACLLGACTPGGSIKATDLAAEFRANPDGIGTPHPRLSWSLTPRDPDARGVEQRAYRVVAAFDPQTLRDPDARPDALAFDTGLVDGQPGRDTRSVPYAGKPLGSRARLWWRVMVIDHAGKPSPWSDIATLSLGLMRPEDWHADWIGLDAKPQAPLTAERRDYFRKLPWARAAGGPERSPRKAHIRGEFTLPAGEIESAYFAGTADQFAEVRINGKEAGRIARWEFIRPIDVTGLLRRGSNAVAVSVLNEDGHNPAVSGAVIVRMKDGKEHAFAIDKSCLFVSSANAEPAAGWDMPGYAGPTYGNVEISGSQPWGSHRNTEHFLPPVPYLRTTFETFPGKTVAAATLYSTALGVYEARLNGKDVTPDVLSPGWTEYSKRVYHQTYDVTALLDPGTNCLGVLLGDGWYAGQLGFTGRREFYGGPARFMGQLEIQYTDGSTQLIPTNASWKASFGAWRHADIYLGVDYDARQELQGWDTPTYNDSAWSPVAVGLSNLRQARSADVTNAVRSALAGGKSFVVGPAVLGDPAFGVVKTLTVDYRVGDASRSISLREGERLSLPQPGESGEVTILRATFAEPPPPAPGQIAVEPNPGEPMRRHEELVARSVSEPKPGRFVFDLGQNIVGWPRLLINGREGQRLVVRYAERLNPDGTLYTSNLRGATSTDFFTLAQGTQTIEPKFTFHGFQYVEVTGLDDKPQPEMVTGVVVHSLLPPAGFFSSSNPLLDRLILNTKWGQKGNYLDVPTDCPQRDERLGWTGDAQFFMNAAAYNFDISSFMSRWLRTLVLDAQLPDGTFAHVAPNVAQSGGSTAWGDAAIVCTHAMHRIYADVRILGDHYEPMKRYIDWLDTRTTAGIAKVGGFGDWVNLGDPTNQELIDTAYRAELLRMMADIASILGKPDDQARFSRSRDETIAAFRTKFIADDGSLRDSGQTGYALLFTMPGLLEEAKRPGAADGFRRAMARTNNKLATGFIGTPRLVPALFEAGLNDLAETLLLNEDYPGWLFQVKLGATTMWERWDGWTPDRGFQDVGMNSFNHYAFGSVADALYGNVAGIRPTAPGFASVLIEPTVLAGLTNARADYQSVRGPIRSAWTKTPRGIRFEIEIPPGVQADIALPVPNDHRVREQGGFRGLSAPETRSGRHWFRGGSGRYVFHVEKP